MVRFMKKQEEHINWLLGRKKVLIKKINDGNAVIKRLAISFLIQLIFLALSITLGVALSAILSLIAFGASLTLFIKVSNEMDKLFDEKEKNNDNIHILLEKMKEDRKNTKNLIKGDNTKYQYLDRRSSLAIQDILNNMNKPKIIVKK